MWPKRKIWLVAPPDASGPKGVQGLLKTLGIDVDVMIPDQLGVWRMPAWVFGETPATEIVLWPEVQLEEGVRHRLARLGIEICDVRSFLHNLWQDDIIIAEPLNTPTIEQRPLAYQILLQADFNPSLLWLQDDGQWLGIHGEGLIWVVPLEWLTELQLNTVGRSPAEVFPDAHWVIREDAVDFYCQKDGRGYCGSMVRWPDSNREEGACRTVAQMLRLGVPWNDVSDAIGSLEHKYAWIRWNRNEAGVVAGEVGTELSPAQSQYLENRRAG